MKTKAIILTIVVISVLITVAAPAIAGNHYGELKMIEVDIQFFWSAGTAVMDDTGATYYIGMSIFFNSTEVYPPEYWGAYPLYLPGAPVPIQLTVTNLGPRAVAKHTLVTEAYTINLDGTNGDPLIAPQTQYIEVALGETQVINAALALPIAVKGLNRFVISLYHHYNETNDASLVLKKEGIFCPPELFQ